jgi:hypothetical protein
LPKQSGALYWVSSPLRGLSCNVFGNVYFIALAMMRKHHLEVTLDKDEKNQLRQALFAAGAWTIEPCV